MSARKFITTALMASLLSTTTSIAQTSDVPAAVLSTIEIVVDAPRIAELQVVLDVVEQLKAAGYKYIVIDRTFLGRASIVAYSATIMREIIINPTTGEILRDLTQMISVSLPEAAENSFGFGGGSGGIGGGGGRIDSRGGSGGGSGEPGGGSGGGVETDALKFP